MRMRYVTALVVLGIGIFLFQDVLLRTFVMHIYPGFSCYEEMSQLVRAGQSNAGEFGGTVGPGDAQYFADYFSLDSTSTEPYSAIGFPVGELWDIDNWCGVVWVHSDRQPLYDETGKALFSIQSDYFNATQVTPLDREDWYYMCFS